MAVGIAFVAVHAAIHGRTVLIHCAQGKDRSVAVAMACVAVLCDHTYPLRMQRMLPSKFDELLELVSCRNSNCSNNSAEEGSGKRAGLSDSLLQALLGREGRDVVLRWLQPGPIGKETLRIVLQLIQQDRPQANPTRSTMQKLNRFFMSRQYGH